MAQIRQIDLSEWTLAGGGKRGDSYFHNTDPLLMVKFDNSGIPVEDMLQEVENARIVDALGLPTPAPGEVVTDGRRYGITFRRIPGKESYARLVGMYPERIPELACNFAALVKRMHATKATGMGLRNIKDVYGRYVRENLRHGEQLRDKALEVLDSLLDGDTCIHGDLHYGNIIVADGRDYLIDLGNFCYGHPYFDLAMMMAVARFSFLDKEFSEQMYHCNTEQALLFWDCFIKEYFGPDCTREKAEEIILPYYAIRIFAVEAEAGHPLPPQILALPLEYLAR